MFKHFWLLWLGLGLSIGSGIVYLLATDDMFRIAVLVLVVAVLSVAFALAVMVMVSRSQQAAIKAMGEAMRPANVNYQSRATFPMQQMPPLLANPPMYQIPQEQWQQPAAIEEEVG